LFISAQKIDPGKRGETITTVVRKRIKERFEKATIQFKKMLRKRHYTEHDLKLIAAHDTMRKMRDFETFICHCFGSKYVSPLHYQKVLRSNAFKSGRLTRLYDFVPNRIDTRKEFIRFLKSRRGINKTECEVIMRSIACRNWRNWLEDLIDKRRLVEDHKGRWIL